MTPSHLSLVTPRSGTDPSAAAATDGTGAAPLRRRHAALTIAVAALLCATGFVTGGGVDELVATWRNTWTEIGLDVLGALAVGAGVFLRPAGRRHGWATVGLMALLFALEAASIAWSVAPDGSWLASGQMLAYLAVFAGGAALARPLARDWPALLGGFVLWAAVICLWSLIAKVFPATLSIGAQYGRLQAPFGYWNALASVAAMAVPCCLWLGARRDGGRHVAALAVPALALVVTALVLSYSRSADLAAVIGAGVWLVFVPLRLRAVAVAAIGAAGGAVISAWGLTHHGVTGVGVPIAAQDHAGHILGIVVLVVLVLSTVVGVAVTEAMDRTTMPAPTRQRVGSGLLMALAGLVLLAVIAVALSHRGLTGEISHGYHQLVDPAAQVSASSAGRVFEFGSSRPTYWHEALQVGDHAVLKGVGEVGFSVARLLYPGNPEVVLQAHSYVFETYADLGVLGLLISALLLLSWLGASARTIGLLPRARALTEAQAAERIGMVSLATLVLAFGVQSTLDWTWFFTGVAAPALLAAGWLAGRGPVHEPLVAAPRRAALDRPGALIGCVALLGIVLLGGWMTWRPLHSAQLVNRAENAGDYAAAASAQRADPLATLPYVVLADFDADAHDLARGVAQLHAATREQPRNPASWSALAQFEFAHGLWRESIAAADRVAALDRSGDVTEADNAALIAQATGHLSH